jgi:predicted DNA-binding transcriptional regulator AlpA
MELIKTPQAAERLNVSASFLQKLRCTGEGPQFVRLGRSVFYRPPDLDAWIASRVVTSTSEPQGRQS